MKRFLLITALLSSLFSFSQTSNQQQNAEKQIKKLMNDWMIALVKRDKNTLNKIMAPEFKLDGIYPFNNPPVKRAMWLKNAMNSLKVDSVHYADMKVDVIDNIAIVQSKFYWAGSFFDKPFVDSSSILIDTWMKRKRGWQVVSRLRVDKPE